MNNLKWMERMAVLLLASLLAGSAIPASAAAPVQAAPAPADPDWWAAAQTFIQQDLGLDAIQGLSPTPDWDWPGELADDMLGYSIAGAGDVNGDGYADVIVGAPGAYGLGKEGKAYLFYGSAAGLETSPRWSQIGENDDDNFGFSVAGAGDVDGDGYADVVVGAYTYAGVGRAYVFLGSATGLSLSPLPPLGAAGSDSFGYSVAGAGDVNADGYADILVGDRGYSSSTGRVYVYHGGAGGPDTSADRTLNGEAIGDWFGISVAGAGDVNADGYADVLVGAVGYDEGSITQGGAAYVFHGGAHGVSTTWNWKQHGETPDDWFGSSVAGAGDVNGDGYADVIIAAKYYGGDTPGSPEWGAAYVYHGSAGGVNDGLWDWRALGENDDDRFGASVAGAGDVNGDGYADVVVGAPEIGANRGRAYVYKGQDGGVDASAGWTSDGEADSSYFAFSVAGAGDVNGDGYADVVVGAPRVSDYTGKAYAYHGAGDLPSHDDAWGEEGVSTGDWFGFSVAGAGDVNGDGYSDVVVGAQQLNSAQGRVYVYLGAGDGLPAFPLWYADGENGDDWFGGWVAGAGDVNGDGYADILVGARGYDDGANAEAGKAYLYYGGETTLGGDPWEAVGETGGSQFGSRVAGAGDVNGDGYADILIAAPGFDDYRGKVYVYHGSPSGPGALADRTYEGATAWEHFGFGVAGVGDTNGDGYADVAIGAYGYPSPGGVAQRQGRVSLYTGSAAGLAPISVWTGLGENAGDNFGKTVAGAGDVNGDGCGDIAVGADGFGGVRGKVYLYQGGCGVGGITPAWSGLGNQQLDGFGAALSGAGDVNGDGYADLLVGAPQSPTGSNQGSARLYAGPLSGISYSADWEELGENNGDRFGISVAGAGDVNGDGYADLLVGANTYGSGRGKAYAYLGNDGGARRLLAEQRDTTRAEVQPWGLANEPDRFEVWLWASDPAGRGRLKLQVEACPPGTAFGGAACTLATSSTWDDLFPLGGYATQRRLRLPVRDLAEGTLYHWRARVLYAPYTVVRTAITPPPNPAHGPWRRFQAQAFEADLRMTKSLHLFLPLVTHSQ